MEISFPFFHTEILHIKTDSKAENYQSASKEMIDSGWSMCLWKSKDLSHEMRRIFHQTEEQRMNLSLTATVSLNACLDVGITSRLTLIILLLMFMIGLNKPSCRKMAGNEKENKNKNEAQITNSKLNGHWNVNTWGFRSDLLAHSCLISMLING